jgi:hypothetical protein
MSESNVLSRTFTEAGQFTPIPNWVLDKIVADRTIHSSVVRVFLYLFRETVGWNDPIKNISLKHIQNGAGVSRERAIHAIRVICEGWGSFTKTRGQKGGASSTYMVAGHLFKNEREAMEEAFHWRSMVLIEVYGTICPTPKQIANLPPDDVLNMPSERWDSAMVKPSTVSA